MSARDPLDRPATLREVIAPFEAIIAGCAMLVTLQYLARDLGRVLEAGGAQTAYGLVVVITLMIVGPCFIVTGIFKAVLP